MRHELIAVMASVTLVGSAVADPAQGQPESKTEASPSVEHAKIDKTKVVPSLLVMSAKSYSYRDGKLTLEGISPMTISFADRPSRLAGSVPTEHVVADWAAGRDSFEKVPPNADFSVFDENGASNAVVELKNPVLKGDNLTYDVRILKGKLAEHGQGNSLFIDIIGMPFTPMSFAGVARRTARRAAYWGMAGAPYVAPGYYVPPHVVVY